MASRTSGKAAARMASRFEEFLVAGAGEALATRKSAVGKDRRETEDEEDLLLFVYYLLGLL